MNEERRERHGYNHPRRARSRFILTDLVRCARCGQHMHGRMIQNNQRKSYDYYRCGLETSRARHCGSQLIPKEELETRVIERPLSEALTLEALTSLYQKAQEKAKRGDDGKAEQIARLQAELKDATTRAGRLAAAIAEMGHSPTMLRDLRALEVRQGEITGQLTALRAERRNTILPDLSATELERHRDELIRRFKSDKPAVQSEALRSILIEVRAERIDKAITGTLLYTPPFGGDPLLVSL